MTLTAKDASRRTRDICALAPIVPVLVIENVAQARPLAEALVAGGLPALEVTLRTPAALDVIREMAGVKGGIVGAGDRLAARGLADHQYPAGITEFIAQDVKIAAAENRGPQVAQALGIHAVQPLRPPVFLTIQALFQRLAQHRALTIGDSLQIDGIVCGDSFAKSVVQVLHRPAAARWLTIA